MSVVSNKHAVMTLYSDPKSIYSHQVRMVLAEKNITVEIIDTDPLNPAEDLMDLNPYGVLPTLVDRDLTLYQARIIMEYLDERFPHPPLLPVDPVSRASARLYMHRVDRDWYRLLDQIEIGGAKASAARKALKEALIAAAPIFAAKPYFMSDEMTLVDCSIAPLLWRLPDLGIELTARAKAVNDYAQSLFGRESFQQSLTEIEREMRG